MKPYLTTGDVGKVCGVSETTVRTWIRKEMLPAHRLPSASWKFADGYGCRYRILPRDLEKFCKEHGVPYEPHP